MKMDKHLKQASGRSSAKPKAVSVHLLLASLSPGRLETLSPRELQRVSLQLLVVLQKSLSKRPTWWPHILPWTFHRFTSAVKTATPSSLRNLARKCYNYLTQNSTRLPPAPKPLFMQPRVLDWVNSHPPGRSCAQPVKSCVSSTSKKPAAVPYLDIYLCYQCNEEFSAKDALQKHQVQCRGGTLPLAIPSTPPISEAPSPAPATSTPDDSGSVGVASASTSPNIRPGLSQSQFVTALDLVPIHRARKIRQARRRNTECETIDLEEPQTPVSPSTPRSHKILITQLSRDASSNLLGGSGSPGGIGSRRSSCLRLSLDKRPDNIAGEKEKEQDAESDGESSESNTEDADDTRLRKKSLFSIDVSSALGQRVLKHMTTEIHVPVISNLEEFCRTPIKDKYQDRLRIRHPYYPVTWKLTRKRQLQHSHLYKFTRAHKLDFQETLRTGLNWQSRKLRDILNKCTVVVNRLSRKTVLKWTSSQKRVSLTRQFLTQAKSTPQPSVFPEGPTFLLTDVDRVLGLKRKDGRPELARKLLASHCVSETANAELQSQKLTVYRCLLTDLYSSVASDGSHQNKVSGAVKEQAVAVKNKQNFSTLLSILSNTGSECTFTFPQKERGDRSVDVQKPLKIDIPSPVSGKLMTGGKSSPLDDSFSVKTLSSDEDNSKSTACCSLCAVRNKCECLSKETMSGVVGPVSASPALSTKMSTRSQRSLSPPELDPLSLTPKVSVSSHPSISPPNLSPVSQVGEKCSPSPASATRLLTRRNTLLLKTSSSLPKLSSAKSQLAVVRSGSSLPGQGTEWSRSDKRTTRQAHNSVASSASGGLLQPLLIPQTHGPLTRSGSKNSVIGDSSGFLLQQKPSTTTSGSTCNVAGQGLNPMAKAKGVTTSSVESTLTSLSLQVDDKNKSCQAAQGSVTVQRRGRPGQKSESSPCMDSPDTAHPKEQGKETQLKGAAETSKKLERKTAKGEVKDARTETMQTRGSLEKSAVDSLKSTGHQEKVTDSGDARTKKAQHTGDTSYKVTQNVEGMDEAQTEDGGKVRKKEMDRDIRQKNQAPVEAAEEKDSSGNGVDRNRTSSNNRTLRNRETKHYGDGRSKQSAGSENTHTEKNGTQEMKKVSKIVEQRTDKETKDGKETRTKVSHNTDGVRNGESRDDRILRSRDTKDRQTVNEEEKMNGEVNGKEERKSAEIKTKEAKEREVGKLDNKGSQQVKMQLSKMTKKHGEGRLKDSQDVIEVKKDTKDTRVMRSAVSKDAKEVETKDTGSAGDGKEPADNTKMNSSHIKETVGQNVSFNSKSFTGNGNQLIEGKSTATHCENRKSSHDRNEVSRKEQATTASLGKIVLRKKSSRKKIGSEEKTDVSWQTDHTENNSTSVRQTTRKTLVSSTDRTEETVSKKSEQKVDTFVSASEPRGLTRKRTLTSAESKTEKTSLASIVSKTSSVNPFLISRAQTRLFSSRIKEQARKAWKKVQKSQAAKGSNSRGLRSGNTFRMGKVFLSSLTSSFSGEPSRTEDTGHSNSSILSSDHYVLSPGSTFSSLSPVSLGGGGSHSPRSKGLSPKQMLSVLESAKGSTSPSKVKSEKQSPTRATLNQGSTTKSSVTTPFLTKNTNNPGIPVKNSGLQESPAKGTNNHSSPAKRNSNQKSPVKGIGIQNSAVKTVISHGSLPKSSSHQQKSPVKTTGKVRSPVKSSSSSQASPAKSGSSQKKAESGVTNLTVKRPLIDSGAKEPASPRKKMRV